MASRPKPMDGKIAGRYKLGRKLGSGSFGEIFRGTNTHTGEDVAIKMEPVKSRAPQLLFEAKVYKVLYGGVGVPSVHWYGTEGDHNIMVIDLLGPSLEDVFTTCHRRFSLKTTVMLAEQMICRLEYMHAKNMIHRDIKPDNFLIGTGAKAHKVFVIDFGLAKRYRDPRSLEHIPYRENKALTGTARYASVNAHLGIEQSRRDDLEAVGYVLVYFMLGSLPWQGLPGRSKLDKYEQIMQKKASTPPEALCSRLPIEFSQYLQYCRRLKFEDRPDYAHLRGLLTDIVTREGCALDHVFDWTTSGSPTSPSQQPRLQLERQPLQAALAAGAPAVPPAALGRRDDALHADPRLQDLDPHDLEAADGAEHAQALRAGRLRHEDVAGRGEEVRVPLRGGFRLPQPDDHRLSIPVGRPVPAGAALPLAGLRPQARLADSPGDAEICDGGRHHRRPVPLKRACAGAGRRCLARGRMGSLLAPRSTADCRRRPGGQRAAAPRRARHRPEPLPSPGEAGGARPPWKFAHERGGARGRPQRRASRARALHGSDVGHPPLQLSPASTRLVPPGV
eukprot:CAMPEP_0176193342 /NCGR_PEP_ID=MMETSP0121_2-20121125/5436_1 /TAXON_ID=160619 /ORGANISM="Kryptoperidinium foliaceum, Strain CCMP 1326" /LENGTH=561 /DNA_ID=CAMNT_0017532055 /DNA_START=57 /DNA_END=1741 /DNA_ORIENTATION=-